MQISLIQQFFFDVFFWGGGIYRNIFRPQNVKSWKEKKDRDITISNKKNSIIPLYTEQNYPFFDLDCYLDQEILYHVNTQSGSRSGWFKSRY